MHAKIAGVMALVVGLGANIGRAQVYQLPTPAPQVTAANADWQIRAEPIFYAGDFYYPTGPNVFFDGNVMKRTGQYQGVPLYEDATLEPYSIVYVPLGRNLMRPYERRRAGELAGTTGSRTPSFPIVRDVEVSAATGGTGLITPLVSEREVEPERLAAVAARTTPDARASSQVDTRRSITRTSIESIPPPRSNDGIWLEFNGFRWSSAGPAVPYDPDEFTSAGMYRAFPVYQKRGGSDREIYIPAVEGGQLAPFRRQ